MVLAVGLGTDSRGEAAVGDADVGNADDVCAPAAAKSCGTAVAAGVGIWAPAVVVGAESWGEAADVWFPEGGTGS